MLMLAVSSDEAVLSAEICCLLARSSVYPTAIAAHCLSSIIFVVGSLLLKFQLARKESSRSARVNAV
jgi:hypothetical protein